MDEAVLGMVADRLSAAMGEPWQVADGMARGPGALGVVLGDCPGGGPGHLDLDFVLDLDRPRTTTITDCVAGYGATAAEAVERAVRIWLDTTAGTILELLVQDGSHAAHFGPDDPEGLPGWHAVHGAITGWGTGDAHDAVQDWAVQHVLLPHLAPALKGTLERDRLIGVKAFFGAGGEPRRPTEPAEIREIPEIPEIPEIREIAEIRVNGVRHEPASRALADLGWPRPATGASYARTFILLVPDDNGH